MNNIKITSLILIAISMIIITPLLTDEAFAKHEGNGTTEFLEYERHIWSRTAGDGHTGYLNCGTGSNSDNCDLKIKVLSGVQTLTKSEISSEVSSVETTFDNMNKKMSIDKVSSANSYVTQYNLSPSEFGFAEYNVHCTETTLWWCSNKDMHFEKMMVRINNNANEKKFGLSENANASPQIFDVRKTLGHELFHAIGIDHNTSSSSIVNSYTFGLNGYVPNTTDIADLVVRYQ